MRVAEIMSKAKACLLSPPTFFFLTAFVTWPVLAEREAFASLHAVSHAHEHRDLDAFGLLAANLTLALILSLWQRTVRLKRLVREMEEARVHAETNAGHDALTGLSNRRAFTALMNRTAEHLSGKRAACLAMVDLDRFKPVNDLRGHAVGDAVLSAVADRLRDAAGPSTHVARLGGDEFAVLFDPGMPVSVVERRARRIVHVMDQSFDVAPAGVSISCSVGLVVWTPGLRVTEVMRRADTALYKAKAEGRARFAWYDSDLDRRSTERASLELELREAIRSRQVQAWFQPIVDIATHRLTGFEVLARWPHPEKGLVPPQDFIPIAEDCGLIGALGHSILRQACSAARSWPTELSVSVNVSPVQFSRADFVDGIRTALEECAFDGRRLIVEVTESSVIADFEAAREKLTALKDLGISIALDDFGTGYSSLASLRHLPFDRVKIDRSFISHIDDQPTNQKIVQVIMDLANALGLAVTVEGIERSAELTYLEARARGHGQGFLFERPLPPEEVCRRMETSWADRRIDPAPTGITLSPADRRAGRR